MKAKGAETAKWNPEEKKRQTDRQRVNRDFTHWGQWDIGGAINTGNQKRQKSNKDGMKQKLNKTGSDWTQKADHDRFIFLDTMLW